MEKTDYNRIVGKYLDMVYRIAVTGCKNTMDAEDIVQETFCRLLAQDAPFENDEHIKRWRIRVAVNECHTMYRRAWKKHEVASGEVQQISFEQTEDECLIMEKQRLYYAISSLPVKYREILYLFYFEGYSIKEIAEILEMTEVNVRSGAFRARQKLKKILREA